MIFPRYWLVVAVFLVACVVTGVPVSAQDGGIEVLEVDDEPTRSAPSRAVNRILAVVENQAITMRDYQRQFNDTNVVRSRLEQLINKELVRQAGRASGVILDRSTVESFVDTRIREIKGQDGRSFQQFLRSRGLTESEYRQQLIDQVRDQRLQSRVLVQYFPQLTSPDTRAVQQRIRGRLMILPDSATASQVYQTLRDRPRMSTWNELFEEHSRKLSFMSDNGQLNWFRWGTYSREIEYRFFKNALYRLSRPFEFRGRYALVLPTGFRVDSLGSDPSRERRSLYESFRRRQYTEMLSDRLRERFTVKIPASVQAELDRNE